LGANIPDIDVVSFAGGAATYFTYHRWITHAVILAPVMAALTVLVVAAVSRTKLPWFKAWCVALVAVASHLLLDFTNPYGIRLWLPFSDAWPALDATHVVDIWIWAFLFAASLWPMLSGLVGSEIGAKGKPGKGAAIAALIAVTLYDSGRYILHDRAVRVLESRVYDGAAPRRAVAFPHFANPLQWDGWVETERSWQAVDVNLAQEFDPQPRSVSWKIEESPSVAAARRLPIFQVLLKFAQTPLWRVTPAANQPDAELIELIDLRFGRTGRSGFTATAIVDKNGGIVESGFHF
jgi:inner membrane protein